MNNRIPACFEITQHLSFCMGKAVEHIWQASNDVDARENIENAIWYLQKEYNLRSPEKVYGCEQTDVKVRQVDDEEEKSRPVATGDHRLVGPLVSPDVWP